MSCESCRQALPGRTRPRCWLVLADVEVMAVIRRHVQRGLLSPLRGAAAMQDYADLRLERFAHLPLLPRAWQLLDTVTAYDAQYVALAEFLDVPLVTADGRLSRASGLRCQVELLRRSVAYPQRW